MIFEFFVFVSKLEIFLVNEFSDVFECIFDCVFKFDKVIRYDMDNFDVMEFIGFIEFEKWGVIRVEEFRIVVFWDLLKDEFEEVKVSIMNDCCVGEYFYLKFDLEKSFVKFVVYFMVYLKCWLFIILFFKFGWW